MPFQNDSEPVEQAVTTQPTVSPEIKTETVAPAEQQVTTQSENIPSYQQQQILEMGTGQFVASPSSKKQPTTDSVEGDIRVCFHFES